MAADIGNVDSGNMKLICALALFAAFANAAPASEWTLVQNEHFEIYSQSADSANAAASLMWFEELHAFFASTGLSLNASNRVRVIGFRSVKDYDAYRLRATADAYYVGTEARDYIVMPSLDSSKFGVAAHEYAHVVLHADRLHLPAWLSEGLAEFFSTVEISNSRCELGGDIHSHSQTLRSRSWIPLSKLLEVAPDSLSGREESGLFYAQSWAFTDMLLLSPEYRVGLPELITALTAGQASAPALVRVYHKSLASITSDMQTYVSRDIGKRITAPGIKLGSIKAVHSELTSLASRCMLADLLFASGELDRAEKLYSDLAREFPHDSEISAALGTIALGKGDKATAQRQWKEAIEEGITNADLCYRYALLADDAGLPADEIRPTLERAVVLRPDFDDARYKLAILESSAGDYESALTQLKAIRTVAPARAFAYWIAMASAQEQLGKHNQSKVSAQTALQFAATPEDRAEATRLAYVADTELTVQFTRDAKGNPQVTTTRVARGTQSWNPFVEPQDHMRRAEGQLRAVECGNDKVIGVAVDTAAGSLRLTIPDPQHVLVRGVNEFTCGPQPARAVSVEYAASENAPNTAGILRGMEVR